MRTKDWQRIRSRVESLASKRRDYAALAWAAVGAFVTAVFTACTWAPAFSIMDDPQKFAFAWVWPAIIGFGVLGIITAAIGFLAAGDFARRERATAEELLGEMDDIYPQGS
ncbi:hypothetical protein ATL40_1464 [Serinibacter salmoneus]|uniref:Uncharacterized protein n=2 Tax=Serinibacter salmoneus TaxID=556530 RepID=A0A2A9CZL0_9MICO|nr:hypothetical protein ATL40_1464 [Serinibacter salmoneus]